MASKISSYIDNSYELPLDLQSVILSQLGGNPHRKIAHTLEKYLLSCSIGQTLSICLKNGTLVTGVLERVIGDTKGNNNIRILLSEAFLMPLDRESFKADEICLIPTCIKSYRPSAQELESSQELGCKTVDIKSFLIKQIKEEVYIKYARIGEKS